MRLFIGLPLPAAARQRLAGLGGGLPGARWVEARNMHVTLRFIGEVDGARGEDISAALAAVRCPGFELSLDGLGCFNRGRRVHAVWAGVDKSEALAHLRKKVESAVVRAGFEADRHKFKPHVTLARLKRTPTAKIGLFLEAHGGFCAGPFPIERFTLFRSHLNRGGAQYEALADYPLAGE
jgi:2'-5' RNA ligase